MNHADFMIPFLGSIIGGFIGTVAAALAISVAILKAEKSLLREELARRGRSALELLKRNTGDAK